MTCCFALFNITIIFIYIYIYHIDTWSVKWHLLIINASTVIHSVYCSSEEPDSKRQRTDDQSAASGQMMQDMQANSAGYNYNNWYQVSCCSHITFLNHSINQIVGYGYIAFEFNVLLFFFLCQQYNSWGPQNSWGQYGQYGQYNQYYPPPPT